LRAIVAEEALPSDYLEYGVYASFGAGIEV